MYTLSYSFFETHPRLRLLRIGDVVKDAWEPSSTKNTSRRKKEVKRREKKDKNQAELLLISRKKKKRAVYRRKKKKSRKAANHRKKKDVRWRKVVRQKNVSHHSRSLTEYNFSYGQSSWCPKQHFKRKRAWKKVDTRINKKNGEQEKEKEDKCSKFKRQDMPFAAV